MRIPLGFPSGDTFAHDRLWTEPRFARASHPSGSTAGRRGTKVKCCTESRSYHPRAALLLGEPAQAAARVEDKGTMTLLKCYTSVPRKEM